MNEFHNDLATLAKEWYESRQAMLGALSETDSYMKIKGKGAEIVEPLPFLDLWKRLSNAEWALSDFIKNEK